jgi:hypothetical protein
LRLSSPHSPEERTITSARNPDSRAAGKTVDVHYYPNEGHGFVKRENQIDAIRRMIDWFDRYLK